VLALGVRAAEHYATQWRMSVAFSLMRHGAAVRDADSNHVCITKYMRREANKPFSQTSPGPTLSKYDIFLGPDEAC
jgi:hypothetical protein